ncbi:MAG: hypothetical protein ACRDO2_11610, partial [Nocardioidaceae bacterium]
DVAFGTSFGHHRGVHVPDLVDHVATSTGLSTHDAARVVEDVVAYFTESTEDFVRRRHVELKSEGRKNDEIWVQLAGELSERVVAPPRLTDRQLRRIVYG